jgi:hypothetical protein
MGAGDASPAKRMGTAAPLRSQRRSRAPTSLIAAVLGEPAFCDVAWICSTNVDTRVE